MRQTPPGSRHDSHERIRRVKASLREEGLKLSHRPRFESFSRRCARLGTKKSATITAIEGDEFAAQLRVDCVTRGFSSPVEQLQAGPVGYLSPSRGRLARFLFIAIPLVVAYPILLLAAVAHVSPAPSTTVRASRPP